MKRTEKRYYKVGEVVWVKSEKTLGTIKELHVKPDQNIYEAIVEIVNKEQGRANLKVNLWEIDKNKRTYYRDKRKLNKVLRNTTILFAKVRDTAIIPTKEQENAGYDIYADFEGEDFVIQPHETRLVPTGIASSVLDDWSLIAKERGSTGTKGMAVRAGVVDSGYRGEIFIAITNENTKRLVISKTPELIKDEDAIVYPASKAIAQLLLINVPKAVVKEIPYERLKEIPSKRGTGALGSSKK